MKKVLVDVNILLDILQARGGVKSSSQVLLSLKKQGIYFGFVSAITVSILYYFESRTYSDTDARENVRKILTNIKIIDLTEEIIQKAFEEKRIPDFEDCIQYHSAKTAQCDTIVTRNKKDFRNIELDVYTPEEFILVRNRGE